MKIVLLLEMIIKVVNSKISLEDIDDTIAYCCSSLIRNHINDFGKVDIDISLSGATEKDFMEWLCTMKTYVLRCERINYKSYLNEYLCGFDLRKYLHENAIQTGDIDVFKKMLKYMCDAYAVINFRKELLLWGDYGDIIYDEPIYREYDFACCTLDTSPIYNSLVVGAYSICDAIVEEVLKSGDMEMLKCFFDGGQTIYDTEYCMFITILRVCESDNMSTQYLKYMLDKFVDDFASVLNYIAHCTGRNRIECIEMCASKCDINKCIGMASKHGDIEMIDMILDKYDVTLHYEDIKMLVMFDDCFDNTIKLFIKITKDMSIEEQYEYVKKIICEALKADNVKIIEYICVHYSKVMNVDNFLGEKATIILAYDSIKCLKFLLENKIVMVDDYWMKDAIRYGSKMCIKFLHSVVIKFDSVDVLDILLDGSLEMVKFLIENVVNNKEYPRHKTLKKVIFECGIKSCNNFKCIKYLAATFGVPIRCMLKSKKKESIVGHIKDMVESGCILDEKILLMNAIIEDDYDALKYLSERDNECNTGTCLLALHYLSKKCIKYIVSKHKVNVRLVYTQCYIRVIKYMNGDTTADYEDEGILKDKCMKCFRYLRAMVNKEIV